MPGVPSNAAKVFVPGQGGTGSGPLSLLALTLSPLTAAIGAYSGTITGKTSGSIITATSSDGTTLSVSGSTLTGTFATGGTPTITLTETLAGAINSPRVTNISLTVNALNVIAGKHVFIGDSTVEGVAINSSGTVVSNRNLAAPSRYAYWLNQQSVAARCDNIFGWSSLTPAGLTLPASWSQSNGGFQSSNTTDAMTYASVSSAKAIDVYLRDVFNSVVTIQLGSDTPVTVNCGSTNGIRKVTVTTTTAAVGKVCTIKATSGVAYVLAADFYDPSVNDVRVLNLGKGGTQTSDWLGNDVISLKNMALAMQGVRYYCNLGINNANHAPPTNETGYGTDLTALGAAFSPAAEFILVNPTPRTGVATQSEQLLYDAKLFDAATAAPYRVIDLRAHFVNYATMNANGYIYDTLHPSLSGYDDEGAYIAGQPQAFRTAQTVSAPTSVAVTGAPGNTLTNLSLTATAVHSQITSFTVQRATSSGGPFTTIGTVTPAIFPDSGVVTATFSDTGETNGTNYYFRIIANAGAGSTTSAVAGPYQPAATVNLLTAPNDFQNAAWVGQAPLTITPNYGTYTLPSGATVPTTRIQSAFNYSLLSQTVTPNPGNPTVSSVYIRKLSGPDSMVVYDSDGLSSALVSNTTMQRISNGSTNNPNRIGLYFGVNGTSDYELCAAKLETGSSPSPY